MPISLNRPGARLVRMERSGVVTRCLLYDKSDEKTDAGDDEKYAHWPYAPDAD